MSFIRVDGLIEFTCFGKKLSITCGYYIGELFAHRLLSRCATAVHLYLLVRLVTKLYQSHVTSSIYSSGTTGCTLSDK